MKRKAVGNFTSDAHGIIHCYLHVKTSLSWIKNKNVTDWTVLQFVVFMDESSAHLTVLGHLGNK